MPSMQVRLDDMPSMRCHRLLHKFLLRRCHRCKYVFTAKSTISTFVTSVIGTGELHAIAGITNSMDWSAGRRSGRQSPPCPWEWASPRLSTMLSTDPMEMLVLCHQLECMAGAFLQTIKGRTGSPRFDAIDVSASSQQGKPSLPFHQAA